MRVRLVAFDESRSVYDQMMNDDSVVRQKLPHRNATMNEMMEKEGLPECEALASLYLKDDGYLYGFVDYFIGTLYACVYNNNEVDWFTSESEARQMFLGVNQPSSLDHRELRRMCFYEGRIIESRVLYRQ